LLLISTTATARRDDAHLSAVNATQSLLTTASSGWLYFGT
jgi:hypothetical protein